MISPPALYFGYEHLWIGQRAPENIRRVLVFSENVKEMVADADYRLFDIPVASDSVH
jgi:hypothetical protein